MEETIKIKKEISIKFGNTIKDLRTQKGYTIDYIVEKTGLPKDKLEKLEAGDLCLTFTESIMLAEVFEMHLYEILKLIDE